MPDAWFLSKTYRFEAAHHLPRHDGKCARVHGHSWTATIEVAGPSLHFAGPKVDMLMDYNEIDAVVEPIVETTLDHYDLNVSTGLVNPTSEAIARWLFLLLADRLPGLSAVTINETCTSACRYQGR
jgi:6-pyruvoyltetrahydropterin/6-carboxytetrahydropterin synthase